MPPIYGITHLLLIASLLCGDLAVLMHRHDSQPGRCSASVITITATCSCQHHGNPQASKADSDAVAEDAGDDAGCRSDSCPGEHSDHCLLCKAKWSSRLMPGMVVCCVGLNDIVSEPQLLVSGPNFYASPLLLGSPLRGPPCLG